MLTTFFSAAALGPHEGADFGLGFGPDAAASFQPLHKPAVLHGEVAEPVRGKPSFLQELLDFGNEVVSHGAKLHASACKSMHAITFPRGAI